MDVKIDETTPDQFKQDAHNANRGTKRGMAALKTSVKEHGIGRPIVVDKEGRIIAGNKTQLAALDAGIAEAVVVHTTGNKLIVHQRDDLEIDSEEARLLALEDNRIGQLNLNWNTAELKAKMDAGVDIAKLWNRHEIEAMFDDDPFPDTLSISPPVETDSVREPLETRQSMSREEKTYHFQFDLSFDDSILVDRALKEWELSGRDRTLFLVQLAETYINGL